MQTPGIVYGKEITEKELTEIREIIQAHPEWSRRRISEVLSHQWEWRTANGVYRDMAVRHLLNKLEAGGWVELPQRRHKARTKTKSCVSFKAPFEQEPAPITDSLRALQPIEVLIVKRGDEQAKKLGYYLQRYHYLGYNRPIGQNIHYLVRDALGRDLACVCFEAAAWKVAPRERFIGWSDAQRRTRLPWLANNTRFLILPWVRVPHLASHILGLTARSIAAQWQQKYQSPLLALETFVERDRFAGTCYKAANWQYLGPTQGRSRADRYSTLQVPIKDIYLYPLHRHFRARLCA